MHSPRSSSSISEIDSFSDSGLSELEDPLSGSWLDVDSLKDFTDSGSSDISDGGVEDDDRTPFVETKPPLFGHPPSTLGSSYLDPDGSATVASLTSSMGTISSSAYRLTPQPGATTDQGLILPDPLSDSYRSNTEPKPASLTPEPASTPAPASTRLHSFLADTADAAGAHTAVDESWLRAIDGTDEAPSIACASTRASSRAEGEYSLLISRTSEDLVQYINSSLGFFGDEAKVADMPVAVPVEEVVVAAETKPKAVGRDMARIWALRTALVALASFISLATLGSLTSTGRASEPRSTLDQVLEPIRAAQTQSVFSTIWKQVASAPAAAPTHPPRDLQIVKNALSTFYAGMIKVEDVVTTAVAVEDTPITWRQRLRPSTELAEVKSHALQSFVDARAKKETNKQWVFDFERFQGRGNPRPSQVSMTSALAAAPPAARWVLLRESIQPSLERAARAGLVLTRHVERLLVQAFALARQDTERFVLALNDLARSSLRRAARGASIVAQMMPAIPTAVQVHVPSREVALSEAHEALALARTSLDTLAAYVDSTSRQARKGLDNVLQDVAIKGKVVRSRTSRVLEMVHHAALQAVL